MEAMRDWTAKFDQEQPCQLSKMKSEFYRREKAAFFSYSSKDADLARSTVRWLRDCANLAVWLDEKDLAAGNTTSAALKQAIRKCRSYILLLTPNSLRSNWVQQEWEAADAQSVEYKGFKVIALVTKDLDPDDVPVSLQAITRIHLQGTELDGGTAAKLLASLRPDAGQDETDQDVFVTRTWRDEERASHFANVACEYLVRDGFRLIGDEPRADSDPDRLRAIISSCAAYFALIPPRKPGDLSWLLQDLLIAQDCGVPVVIVADPTVIEYANELRTPNNEAVTFDDAVELLAADMNSGEPDKEGKNHLKNAVRAIERARKRPRNPYSVFYATDPARLASAERDDINRVVGRITGRRCVYADEIFGDDVRGQTSRAIADSVATIADVSGEDLDGWVYAGVARGAKRPVDFVTSEPHARVPFLFQNSRPRPYGSHLERVGLVHAVLYTHRRFFLNHEVVRWH